DKERVGVQKKNLIDMLKATAVKHRVCIEIYPVSTFRCCSAGRQPASETRSTTISAEISGFGPTGRRPMRPLPELTLQSHRSLRGFRTWCLGIGTAHRPFR